MTGKVTYGFDSAYDGHNVISMAASTSIMGASISAGLTQLEPDSGAASDHDLSDGTLTISAGTTTGNISFDIEDDTRYENAEDLVIDLGIFYLPFGILVIVGSSNAVNLTDGLDGLAIVPVMIACLSFALISYLVGNSNFSNYLQINYVPGVGELAVLAGALVGAGLGFLWFNAPPAMVFMGDTGSLSLGAFLGSTALAVRHEIVLILSLIHI